MSSAEPEQSTSSEKQKPSFGSLGLIQPLLEAIERLGYKTPTDIQLEAIPHALQGRDIIGVASTGSGKTAAFALPILQKLWDEPKGLFACVLAPTRELAYQISQQFEALGSAMGVRCTVLVGGMDMVTQSIALAKRPHIVVATPGRLKDHLENTKGFSLRGLRFLVSIRPSRRLLLFFSFMHRVASRVGWLILFPSGPRRSGSSAGHGLWAGYRRHSQGHPEGADDVFVFGDDDDQGRQAPACKLVEPRPGGGLDKVNEFLDPHPVHICKSDFSRRTGIPRCPLCCSTTSLYLYHKRTSISSTLQTP